MSARRQREDQRALVHLVADQLRWIGFEGDPLKEVARARWYADHQWPSAEMEGRYRQHVKATLKKLYNYRTVRLAREADFFLLNYGIKSYRA
jgi:hypothetical protein